MNYVIHGTKRTNYIEVFFIIMDGGDLRRSVVILNCSLSPNGLMRPKAEWAIDSEAKRVRGIIIVLVKSN